VAVAVLVMPVKVLAVLMGVVLVTLLLRVVL
jgi:hypothetical protein